MGFDTLLFGPWNVVRTKQALHGNWELHSRTRIGRQEFFPNGDIQHTPQDSELLMDGRRL
jgi:hypothetical protein